MLYCFYCTRHTLAYHLAILYFSLLSLSVFADAPNGPEPSRAAEIDAQQHIRQQERERALEKQHSSENDIRLSRPDAVLPDYPLDEKPCFTLHTLVLQGDEAKHFQWALDAASGAKGRCLGNQGVGLVMNQVQNALLQAGYVTSRVVAQEQDLNSGVLTITLLPGRIDAIGFRDSVSYRARLWNAIPTRSGDILNLRDIEQGIENFKRVPSVDADIHIVPGGQDGTSDLQVSWKESRPVRLSVGFDDSGSESTGKYMGSTTLSLDAPFAQNDLFYVNLSKDLFNNGPFGSGSRTVNYSIPYGYWQLFANYNDYRYHQAIANINETLTYRGDSDTIQATLSRILFRNQSHKTTLTMRLYRRQSSNFVNNIEMALQRRRTAGWELGLSQRSYLNQTTLDSSLTWRHGIGAFGALPAPEEAYNGGTSRPNMLMADLTIDIPFQWQTQRFRYTPSLRGQWSETALTPQDRLAIGGRHSVRGFDGERSLSAEKGLIWRNELAWNIANRGHETYWALDYGRVSGQARHYLVGQQLAGTAIGLRGALFGRLSYDVFIGVPLYKPHNFETASVAGGFSLNLQI
jgi:hemolysin activation/secretion protein